MAYLFLSVKYFEEYTIRFGHMEKLLSSFMGRFNIKQINVAKSNL